VNIFLTLKANPDANWDRPVLRVRGSVTERRAKQRQTALPRPESDGVPIYCNILGTAHRSDAPEQPNRVNACCSMKWLPVFHETRVAIVHFTSPIDFDQAIGFYPRVGSLRREGIDDWDTAPRG
jgi:hypothetical protein